MDKLRKVGRMISKLMKGAFSIGSSGVAILLTVSYALSGDTMLCLASGLLSAGTLFIPP